MVELVPAVNVYRGKIIVEPDGTIISRKPVEYIQKVLEKFEKAFVFDLDGIQRNKPQWSILKKFETKDLWVDAGVRTADSIIELFIAGANKVVLSTSSLWHHREIEDAYKLSENLMIRIALEDTPDLKVIGRKFNTSLRDLIYELRDIGIKELVFSGAVGTTPLSAGTVDSVLEMIKTEEFDVYVAVQQDHEKDRLEGMGVRGIIIDAKELV
jgi:phosphoribosylformimino-5-aminoimidazole carboxamide ribonucleotide (ProFAR) isomerase